MFRVLTKEEMKQHRKELKDFCEKYHCPMYNIMDNIEKVSRENEDDLKIKILKKIERHPANKIPRYRFIFEELKQMIEEMK